jgi:DNA mismatch repair protein MutL
MSRVRVLPEVVASQVAAGEVIERPASVVKELVENSLDARAASIEVEIRRGGVASIRVSDDGVGMGRDDALLAIERHATSKLRDADGLAGIRTLGFRGEALPSIASVAFFELATRPRDAVAGTEIEIACGTLREVRDSGCAPGTRVEVRQLFHNVPARRKFLRTEATESAHVEHQLRLHALAAPGVRFRYLQDKREVFDLPAVGDRQARIAHLHGNELAGALIALTGGDGETFTFDGYFLPAGKARRGRRHQMVFLNGRPIEDAAVARGLREGFRGGLAAGLNPSAWLWIEMDPEWVDVNVHPAKREVRFRRADRLAARLAEAVAEALRPPPARDSSAGVPEGDADAEPVGSPAPVLGRQALQPGLPAAAAAPPAVVSAAPDFEVLGDLAGRFVLLGSQDGLVLLDPRAARERIVYERMRRDQAVESQRLLVPVVVELGPLEADLVQRNLENLASAGLEVEPFGGRSFQLSALPVFLAGGSPEQFLHEMVERLVGEAGGTIRQLANDQLAQALAKQAGSAELASPGTAQALLDELFACELPYCAADGRPTLLEMSLAELERRFQV